MRGLIQDRRRRRQRIECRRSALSFENLEARTVLSASALVGDLAQMVAEPDLASVQKVIVAGDPNGSPSDSPDNRIDANTTASPFRGVGGLFMDLPNTPGGFLCSGTVISPTHVLTAGHCLDADDDGSADFAPSDVSFYLNDGVSTPLVGSALHVHPDFTGFANPSVLDDIAIVELSSSVSPGVPIYGINTAPFVNIETITMVGYGTTGDAVNGYLANTASLTTKRVGQNRADVYISDDEGSGAREGFEWDMDGDHKRTNVFGPPTSSNMTLGNDIETTVGGGDSGGPAFVGDGNGGLLVFGVNTFTGGGGKAPAPFFGSIGGGNVVSAYADWINSIIGGINQAPQADAGADQNVSTGFVQLDGSGSSDPENDPLTYSWSLSVPSGSNAVLSDPSAVNPTFDADIEGQYVATLIVNDGTNNSAPDTAIITVSDSPGTTAVHVHDLDGLAKEKGRSGKWSADVSVTIHDNNENPVAGVTVTGQWSGDASGTVSGATDAAGRVQFSTGNLSGGSGTAIFTVTDVQTPDYDSGINHDDDGDSDGTTITINRDNNARIPAIASSTIVMAPSSESINEASSALWLDDSDNNADSSSGTVVTSTSVEESSAPTRVQVASKYDSMFQRSLSSSAVDAVISDYEEAEADEELVERLQ